MPPRFVRLAASTRLALIAPMALVGLNACTNLTQSDVEPNRYGSVSIRAVNAPNSRAKANATAIFFEAYTAAVPNSALQQSDQCVYSAIDTTTVITKGVKKAGSNVTLGVAGTSINLPYDDLYFRYANPETTPFTYAGGDVAQATIPGDAAVFPASTISVKLAEPLYPGPVVIPSGTASMVFSWNGTSDTTSAIILSLRYANPATSTYANEQIYCALRDDGSHQLPSTALAAFLASPNSKRSLVLTRWRTREVSVDARTLLHIATSVDTTIVFQP